MNPIETFLGGAQFFDTTTLAQQNAALYWFAGGVLSALVLCAFSTIIRATKGAAGNVDL